MYNLVHSGQKYWNYRKYTSWARNWATTKAAVLNILVSITRDSPTSTPNKVRVREISRTSINGFLTRRHWNVFEMRRIQELLVVVFDFRITSLMSVHSNWTWKYTGTVSGVGIVANRFWIKYWHIQYIQGQRLGNYFKQENLWTCLY